MHSPNKGSAKFGRTRSRNNRKSRIVGGYFNRLPCEILHTIALMLPFNSIKQLKYSSKFWYNLLTDPKFVDLHLTHALEKPPGYFLTALPKLWLEKETCYFAEQLGCDLSTSKIFDYSIDDDPDTWHNFQSSGGLMCAYSSQSNCFRIFNPHIAEEIQVPRDPKSKRWCFIRFFFSYSPSIKEYKILKYEQLIEKEALGSTVAGICTLGSNIWRDIERNVPSTYWYIDGYIHCQGNPFWMEESGYYLHFFDFVSEKFQVIPGPPGLDRVHLNYDYDCCYDFMRGKLISMGDTVGYIHNYKLWVLEDKTKGIWINRYDFSIPRLYKYANPIATSENGHLFGYVYIEDSTKVFSHDIGNNGFRIVEMKLDEHGGEEQPRSVQVEYMAPHVRSFVSPLKIKNMGKKLNQQRKFIFDTLKLDYDASEDDLIKKMYEFILADIKKKGDKNQDL